jgi:hypothetical protein
VKSPAREGPEPPATRSLRAHLHGLAKLFARFRKDLFVLLLASLVTSLAVWIALQRSRVVVVKADQNVLYRLLPEGKRPPPTAKK